MFKKSMGLFMCVFILFSFFSASTNGITIVNPYSLVITEVCRDAAGSDLSEAIEVLNVSDKPLDLYNYTLWRYLTSDNDWDKINQAIPASSDLSKINITETQNEYVLQPGEIAICWFIFADVYNTDYVYNNINYGRLATKNQSNKPEYHIDKFKTKVENDQGITIPESTKIIPIDSTLVSGGFHLVNSSSFRLYLTPRGENIDAAIAIADVMPPASRANSSEVYGPADERGKRLKVLNHFLSPPTYSQLLPEQQNLWASFCDAIPTVSVPSDNLWVEPTIEEYDYTFAVIPDTQYITAYLPNELKKIPNYIASNLESQKIKFVMHLGDITNKSTPAEWAVAKDAFSSFRDLVPHSIIPGNHDYNTASNDRQTNLDSYNEAFPIEDYHSLSYFGGAFEEDSMANTYQKIAVDDVKYLFLALEFAPRNEVLAWADEVVSSHPEHNVIVTTHAYMNKNGNYYSKNTSWADYDFASADGNWNDTNDMWNKLLSKHENIIMVICGHSPTEVIRIKNRKGINGNKVFEITVDGQDTDLNQSGAGMIMLMRFSQGGEKITLQYYSVLKETYYKTENQNLVLKVPIIGKTNSGDKDINGSVTITATASPDTTSAVSHTMTTGILPEKNEFPIIFYIIIGFFAVATISGAILILIRKKRIG